MQVENINSNTSSRVFTGAFCGWVCASEPFVLGRLRIMTFASGGANWVRLVSSHATILLKRNHTNHYCCYFKCWPIFLTPYSAIIHFSLIEYRGYTVEPTYIFLDLFLEFVFFIDNFSNLSSSTLWKENIIWSKWYRV